jgi:hypothetical protein
MPITDSSRSGLGGGLVWQQLLNPAADHIMFGLSAGKGLVMIHVVF